MPSRHAGRLASHPAERPAISVHAAPSCNHCSLASSLDPRLRAHSFLLSVFQLGQRHAVLPPSAAAADQESRRQSGVGACAGLGSPLWCYRFECPSALPRCLGRHHAAWRICAVGRAGACRRQRGRGRAEARLAEAPEPAGRALAAQPWRQEGQEQELLPPGLWQPTRVERRGGGVRGAAGALPAAAASQQPQARAQPGQETLAVSLCWPCCLLSEGKPLVSWDHMQLQLVVRNQPETLNKDVLVKCAHLNAAFITRVPAPPAPGSHLSASPCSSYRRAGPPKRRFPSCAR